MTVDSDEVGRESRDEEPAEVADGSEGERDLEAVDEVGGDKALAEAADKVGGLEDAALAGGDEAPVEGGESGDDSEA